MERGWMYVQLKARITADESWMDICKELGVCSRTANRYITLFDMSSMYPRIIICDINFETLMYCKDEITSALYNNWELGVRFRVPLRNVEIRGNIQFDGEAFPRHDTDDEEDVSADAENDWNAGWDIVDKM